MTTAVQIYMPKPNHKRVRVEAISIDPTGKAFDSPAKVVELDHGDMTGRHDFHVHGSMILKITEID